MMPNWYWVSVGMALCMDIIDFVIFPIDFDEIRDIFPSTGRFGRMMVAIFIVLLHILVVFTPIINLCMLYLLIKYHIERLK